MDIGKIFRNGRSQAVRLPAAYRFEGDAVRVSRVGRGVLLEPIVSDPKAWFAEMDATSADDLMPDGRSQPDAPSRDIFD
jgi:antitoxin VapB